LGTPKTQNSDVMNSKWNESRNMRVR
jgi:hypothetical protein